MCGCGCGCVHPVVTRTLIFGVDQYKFNRRNRCRRTGASRPRCAARIPDRSTGTVDVYAQHAFPPKASGRTTRPRCVRGGQPDWPGIASSFRASRVRPIQLYQSVHMVGAHSKFTFGLSIMRGSRAARGWLPSRGRAARPIGSPIARNCGARQHLHSCVSAQQCPPALQGAPNLPI